MIKSLDEMIQEAQQLVVPASHGQRPSDHQWVAQGGGRACPRGGNASQAVYECQLCGAMDYGDPPGPGFEDCFSHPHGCDDCFSLEDQIDMPSVSEWVPVEQYRRAMSR